MENELKGKIKCNWSRLKDELSASSRVIEDIALENNILNFGDLEAIVKKPPIEKINFILLKVVKLNKCDLFLNVIEKEGFKPLCNAVRNTVIQIEPIERGLTYSLGSDMSLKEILSEMKQELDDARTRQIEMKQELENDRSRQIERDEKMEQSLNEIRSKQTESQEQMEKMEKHFELALAEAKSKYDTLQSAYENARSNIDNLTLLAQKKTLEIAELKASLKDSVKETKHTQSKEEKEHELENLRDKLKRETEINEDFKNQIERLNSKNENITTQLLETKNELEQKRGECDRLEKKSQSEYDDIMKKIDSLTRGNNVNISKQSEDAPTGARPKNNQTTKPKEKTASTSYASGYKEKYRQRKSTAPKRK